MSAALWIVAVALLAGLALYLSWRSGEQWQARSALASHTPVDSKEVRPTSYPPYSGQELGQPLNKGLRSLSHNSPIRITFAASSV